MTKLTAEVTRHPRETISVLAFEMADKLKNYTEEVFFGGSFCRGEATCGDLDIAVMGWPELPGVLMPRMAAKTLRSGPALFSGLFPVDNGVVKVDLWLFKPYQWGPGCMFVAGSGRLNVIQRARARSQGYNLGFDVSPLSDPKKIIPFGDQESVYKFFNWPWIPYEKRSI